jgi:hypothetical protein
MSGFPAYDEPTPVAGGGGHLWTAAFDSYDSRTENLYYLISVLLDGQVVRRFVVSVTPCDDPRDELARLAAGGVTNTAYRGYNR